MLSSLYTVAFHYQLESIFLSVELGAPPTSNKPSKTLFGLYCSENNHNFPTGHSPSVQRPERFPMFAPNAVGNCPLITWDLFATWSNGDGLGPGARATFMNGRDRVERDWSETKSRQKASLVGFLEYFAQK